MKLSLLIPIVIAGFLSSCAPQRDSSQQLFRKIENTESSGDFFTLKQAETICPDLYVLLHVTKADVRQWAAQKGLKEGQYDIYPLLALYVPLLEETRHQDYVVAHFDEILHPDSKDLCAFILFDKERQSPSLIKHLKQMFAMEDPNAFIRRGSAKEWEKMKKKVQELPEPQVGTISKTRKAQP